MAVDVERLEGWKQVAGFLNKDLRTVQRWERLEGLPVHRHVHRSQGSVFAYPQELEQWVRERTSKPPVKGPVAEEPRPWYRRRIWLVSVPAVLAVLCAAGWFYMRRSDFSSFHQGDLALVGRIENQTGNRLLDGTLSYLLSGEMARSGWIRVVPRDQVRDALGALKLPAHTEIDRALGERIVRSQGNIRLLITGEARQSGGGYAFSIRLEDPATRATASSPVVTVAQEGSIAQAMRRLSDWARRRLGDTRPGEALGADPETATTRSPAAADLYSRALAVRLLGTAEEAAVQERLLREAVRVDPAFASAWQALCWALKRQGKPKAEWMPLLEKAHQLSAGASLEERLRIDADYAMMRRDYGDAIAARRAYLQLYPDSSDALRRLILAYEWTGRYEEALSLAVSHVTRRPEDRLANYVAGLGMSNWAGDIPRARAFAAKASALGAFDTTTSDAGFTWADCFPLFQLWVEGHAGQLEAALDATLRTEPRESGDRRDNLLRFLGLFYLNLGHTADAQAVFARMDARRQPAARALVAFLSGAKQPPYVGGHFYPDSGVTAVILARSGQLRAARAARTALESIQGSDGDLMAVDAEILAASGAEQPAIALFREALRCLRLSGSPLYYLGSERLATLLVRRGQAVEAKDILKAAVDARARAYNEMGPSGAFWMRDVRLLADLNGAAGRAAQAGRP
jgi:tetratricopeptide (TPR) repeat protein